MGKKRGKLRPCPKCGNLAPLHKHHYLPQRFYGKNPFYIEICDDCHEEVEKLIPETKQLTPAKYFKILYDFITDKHWEKKKKKEERKKYGGFNPENIAY